MELVIVQFYFSILTGFCIFRWMLLLKISDCNPLSFGVINVSPSESHTLSLSQEAVQVHTVHHKNSETLWYLLSFKSFALCGKALKKKKVITIHNYVFVCNFC
jgi:hypothetical protein